MLCLRLACARLAWHSTEKSLGDIDRKLQLLLTLHVKDRNPHSEQGASADGVDGCTDALNLSSLGRVSAARIPTTKELIGLEDRPANLQANAPQRTTSSTAPATSEGIDGAESGLSDAEPEDDLTPSRRVVRIKSVEPSAHKSGTRAADATPVNAAPSATPGDPLPAASRLQVRSVSRELAP